MNEKPTLQKYAASHDEVTCLRAICKKWRGEFWLFDSVLNFLSMKGAELYYVPGEDCWLGCILARTVMDSSEIMFIYVDNLFRKQTLGTLLLTHLLDQLSSKSIKTTVSLEVKSTNNQAIGLYKKLGFKQTSERKAYYSTGEDALIFQVHVGRDAKATDH